MGYLWKILTWPTIDMYICYRAVGHLAGIRQVERCFSIKISRVRVFPGEPQELRKMLSSTGLAPSEIRTLIDVLDTDDDGDMAAWHWQRTALKTGHS